MGLGLFDFLGRPLDDLVALAGIERAGRRLAGAIVGKAIYEGRFTVAEALGAPGVGQR